MIALVPEVDHRALLRKHAPVLRFSSLESYRPDAVEVMTERFDTPGASPNWLKRKDGHVIAATHPAGDQARLSIDFLRRAKYANQHPVKESDYLDIGGRDYVADARIRHANPAYANRVYGRVVTDGGGTWLQYWFYYFYNSKSFIVGEHEGDWEFVQLRIGADGKPVQATYSQHSFGEKRPWAGVRKVGVRPIVFVAVASHACYFQSGRYRVERRLSFLLDHALGDGESNIPTLVDITDGQPSWVEWPGRWGSTSSLIAGIGASPSSPCKQETRWQSPSTFHKEAIERPPPTRAVVPIPAPPTPTITVRRDGDGAVVRYSIKAPRPDQTEPVLLVVSLDPGAETAPPATYSFPLERLRGTVRPPATLEDRPYVVRAVTVDATGMLSPEASAELPA
jgi:hypothetical protein